MTCEYRKTIIALPGANRCARPIDGTVRLPLACAGALLLSLLASGAAAAQAVEAAVGSAEVGQAETSGDASASAGAAQPEQSPSASGDGIAAESPSPNKPEPAAAATTASTPLSIHATWNDRLVFESDNKQFYLQPIVILQPLVSLPMNADGDYPYEGLGFTLRRAALGVDVRLFKSVRTFFLSNVASGTLSLWDFFTDLDFFDGHAVLRMGRFRPWFARQRLLAGDRYQMIQLPTAMTDLLEMGDGRDLGAGVFGLLANKTLEYNLGVWNGEQKYSVEPVNGFLPSSSLRNRGNIDFELGARLVVHPFSYLPAIDESDLEYSESPKMSLGAAMLLAKRHDQRAPMAGFAYYDDRVMKAGAELAFRWRGFSFEAEGFLRKSWMLPTTGEEGKAQYEALELDEMGTGAYAQTGYFLARRRFELTARFDYVDVEPGTAGYMLRPSGGANLFLHGYNALIQFMYRANIGQGFDKDADGGDMSYWRSLRPSDRTDVYLGDRPMARTTHDFFLMMQTSL